MIKTKRAYEPRSRRDGARYLVDRYWPRGIKKEALKIEGWTKEIAPSDSLRRWFNHDPDKWIEFQRRYRSQLARKKNLLEPLIEAARQGNVTLLYSAHDCEHNNALVVQSYLEEMLQNRR